MIKKHITLGGVIHPVELTDEEESKLMDELLEKNIKQMKKCLEKAELIATEEKLTTGVLNIALALFEKQATASFSVIHSSLEEKQKELVKKLREKMNERKG